MNWKNKTKEVNGGLNGTAMSEQAKKPKYIVWNIAEVVSLCTKEELDLLNSIVDRIVEARVANGILPNEKFVVVSSTEPYYETVKNLVDNLKKIGDRD